MKYFLTLSTLFLFYQFTFASTLIKVLGQVGDHVLTSREVEMDLIVERVLYNYQGKEKTSESLGRSIKEWVVYKEAGAFGVSMVRDEEVNSKVRAFKAKLASSGFSGRWGELGVRSHELRQLIERKLRAKNFIKFKMSASYVPVTDAEALGYFKKNRSEFGAESFSVVREKIKGYLAQQRADERFEQWYSVLSRKYRVRRLIN